MDYLQYICCYLTWHIWYSVLNLVINGLPSIPDKDFVSAIGHQSTVLNLVINGLPSIQKHKRCVYWQSKVLNLVINGLPSIHCSSWKDS